MTCVDDVLITAELGQRAARKPLHAAENAVIGRLVRELADDPSKVLGMLAQSALALCGAGSAGVCLEEPGGPGDGLRCHAGAGALAAHGNRTLPCNASPCGTVIERNRALLFDRPDRHFPALRAIEPRIFESLLTPCRIGGRTVGAVWAAAHSPERRFDAEDARLLASLADVAAAAVCHIKAATATPAVPAEPVAGSDTDRFRLLSVAMARLFAAPSRPVVLDVIHKTARAIAGADGISVVLRDGEQVHYTAEDAAAPLWSGRRFPELACISGWALRHRQTAVVPDVLSDQRVIAALYEPTFVRSLVVVPLDDQDASAAIAAYWSTPRTPTAAEIGALEALARAAGTALRSIARLDGLRESEARFRQFAENSTDVLWIADAASRRLEYLSPSFERVWGEPRDRVLADLGRWAELVHPQDRSSALRGMPRLLDGLAHTAEYRIIRSSDGEVRWIRDAGFPIHDFAGRVRRVAGIAQDVTGEKEATERQRRLTRELDHRVKNVLALVQAVAAQTIRSSDTLAHFAEGFEGRLAALARAHGMLTSSGWMGAELRALVQQTLEPHLDGRRALHADGPAVRLPPRHAVALAMVLHELSTNAAKYGALSVQGGSVQVAWESAVDREGAPQVRFVWRESGGPTVAPPERRGFGTALIEQASRLDLHGAGAIRFEPEGVVCELSFPLG